MKKLLTITFIIIVQYAFADYFNPDIYIEDFHRLENNKMDYFRYDEGYSISPHHRNLLGEDPVSFEQETHYDSSIVRVSAKIGEIEIFFPLYFELSSYFENNFKSEFSKILETKIDELLGNTERAEGEGLIPEIVIELPKIALPKAIRRFMGDEAGRLSLNGSQKLTIAGNNTERDNATLGEGDRRNDFDLELKQDLNIDLRGTIGEKIHVDVHHQSSSEDTAIPTPSEINVSYDGNEDEIVKSIEGGNISLSLSGSQIISYNASSEGLFGIKSEMEVGNLELTTIIGKDEAKKNTQKYSGNAQADSTIIESRDFVNRTHYFIADPEIMYQLYTETDLDQEPESWVGNAIKLNNRGEWQLTNDGIGLLPDPEKELVLYLDDHNANNNTTTIQGKEINNPDITYNFDILTEGTDYIVDYVSGIISLQQSIDKRYTIGINYTRLDGNVVGNSGSAPVYVKLLRKSNQEANDEQYWKLQIRNIYDLGMQNVKNEGFQLDVFQEYEDGSPDYDLPSELAIGDYTTLNKYLRLDINKDDAINGEDTTVDLESGYIIFPFLKPFNALGDSLLYVEENIDYDEFENYISVKGKIGRDQISLGQMNILPNSVVIKIGPNKKKLQENVDYIVDYDFGIINFLTSEAKDSDVKIDISYQYKPLFAVDSKTILGLRADLRINPNSKIGGTFIYQSEKVKEDKPKIGNENRSIILADIDGEIEYELPFLTKAIDWLPFLKTDQESNVTLSGEVAMSIPRIYGSDKQHDKTEAYIDDMEAILDAYPLGVNRTSWSPASLPNNFPMGNPINYAKSSINYYNPQHIYMRQVYDPESLTEEEERDKISVLACKMKPPEIGLPGTDLKYWAGVMKYVGNQIDFSKKKYIEILVKIDTLNYNQPQQPVTMHVDLGNINENFYTFTDINGEGILDLEDGLDFRDGVLDSKEDVGLDRIKNGNPGDDPHDDWNNDKVIINGEEEYPQINGTENNGKLDSEDLDDNGTLNQEDVYFEYSLSLTDGEEFLQNDYNGWRLYKIPIHDSENYTIISDQPNEVPNIEKISYARVWFETEDSTRVKLVSLDLVGNKWEEDLIRDENGDIISSDEESMNVGIIDNQKSQHYQPAPYTVIKDLGEETLEQSLTIDYNNLGAGHQGVVIQEFRESYNLLSYDKIRFWVYSELEEDNIYRSESDSLIIRLGADSTSYYEIKHAIEAQEYKDKMDIEGWQEYEIKFSDISYLNSLDDKNEVSYSKDGFTYRKIGRPTLTNIEEISLGLKAGKEYNGRFYFDDIRVADPYDDIGFATRSSFHTSFADFSTLDISFNWKTQNFQSSVRRRNNQTYSEDIDFNINNKYNIHKFFPAEWGLRMPLILTRNRSLGIPRFKVNSDILREDLPKEEREKQLYRSLLQRATFSFDQNKTPRSKIMELLVKNTSLDASLERRKILEPTRADTILSYEFKHNYDLQVPIENVDLTLWGNYKFYYFPRLFSNQFKFQATEPHKWRWDTFNDTLPQWLPQANTKDTRIFNTDTQIEYDIFSDISASYELNTQRNLMLKEYWKNVNIGTEKQRSQNITLDYDPHYIDGILSFNASANVDYNEDYIKASAQDSLFYKGRVDRRISGNVTLKNQDMLEDLANWLGSSSTKRKSDNELPRNRENKEQENIQKETLSPAELERIRKEEKKKSEELKNKDPLNKEEKEKTKNEDTKSPNKNEKLKGEDEQKDKSNNTNILASVINYLARLENIQVSYNNSYETSYEDRLERPEFLYQLGLPHILDEVGADKEILMKGITDRFTSSLSLPVLNNLSTTWGFTKEFGKTYGNRSSSEISTTFPNINVTLSEFEKILHAENYLTSSRLTSSYLHVITERGDLNFDQPETRQIRNNFSPLLSWHGNWFHNITTSIGANWISNINTRFYNSYDVVTKADTKSLNGQITWAFSNPKGLKILFLKRTNLTNELTTDLNFSYERTYNTTNGQQGLIEDINKVKYIVTPGASYQFNQSINGGLSSKWEYSNDMKREKDTTTFRLEIWVEIQF